MVGDGRNRVCTSWQVTTRQIGPEFQGSSTVKKEASYLVIAKNFWIATCTGMWPSKSQINTMFTPYQYTIKYQFHPISPNFIIINLNVVWWPRKQLKFSTCPNPAACVAGLFRLLLAAPADFDEQLQQSMSISCYLSVDPVMRYVNTFHGFHPAHPDNRGSNRCWDSCGPRLLDACLFAWPEQHDSNRSLQNRHGSRQGVRTP